MPVAPPTVALVFPGDPTNPRRWSGIPVHLGAAFAALGCRVVRLRAAPSDRVERVALGVLRRTLGDAHSTLGPEMAALRTLTLRRRAGGLPDEVPLVLLGTSFAPPPGRRYVTYDDMTVVQALEYYADWRSLPAWAAEARRRLQARIYRDAVACTTMSEWAARSVVGDYGIDPSRVVVVGVGANRADVPVDRRTWDPPRLLFVGRDWERKNGPAVVRAFTRLRAERPEATLDLVGEHPPQSGPGIRDHGDLPLGDPAAKVRLRELYGQATCFVMPSRHEPAGIVFAEAAAAGLPMIGSVRGGSPDMIGDAGIVIDPDDDAALLAALRELADPERAAELGALARRRAPRLTWEAVAGRMLTALGLTGVLGLAPEAPLVLASAQRAL